MVANMIDKTEEELKKEYIDEIINIKKELEELKVKIGTLLKNMA